MYVKQKFCVVDGCFLSRTCTHTHTYIHTRILACTLDIKFYIMISYTHMHILGSGGSSRPTLNQDTFAAPLAPVRPAPQPPGSSDPAPDIPPRPAATKQQKDLPPAPPPKVPLKPPMPTGEKEREKGREKREGRERGGEREKGKERGIWLFPFFVSRYKSKHRRWSICTDTEERKEAKDDRCRSCCTPQ